MSVSSCKRKVIFAVLIVSILSFGTVYADAASNEAYEAGVYFKDYLPYGSMKDHVSNFAGGGIVGEYHMPLLIPVPNFMKGILPDRLNVGFSVSADFEKGVAESYISSWNAVNIFAGAFLEIPVTEWFSIQPAIEYGVQLDVVASSRLANGVYPSQGLQVSPSFKFRLAQFGRNELKLVVSPFWSVGFETTHNAKYLGLKAGISWKLKNKTDRPEAEKAPVSMPEPEPVVVAVPEPVVEMEPVPEPEPEPVIEIEPVAEPEPEPVVEVVVVEKVEVKQKEDGTVAINIPTLAFMSNSAELTDAESNQKTIQQVFDILNDELYAEYKVIITGYVNPDGIEWTESEKELALNRAETIRQSLISKGIDGSRLEARHGTGKTDNNEFNRRVEFTLTK